MWTNANSPLDIGVPICWFVGTGVELGNMAVRKWPLTEMLTRISTNWFISFQVGHTLATL
jgi:hypothetical protein